jgi:hypothetical protein
VSLAFQYPPSLLYPLFVISTRHSVTDVALNQISELKKKKVVLRRKTNYKRKDGIMTHCSDFEFEFVLYTLAVTLV